MEEISFSIFKKNIMNNVIKKDLSTITVTLIRIFHI